MSPSIPYSRRHQPASKMPTRRPAVPTVAPRQNSTASTTDGSIEASSVDGAEGDEASETDVSDDEGAVETGNDSDTSSASIASPRDVEGNLGRSWSPDLDIHATSEVPPQNARSSVAVVITRHAAPQQDADDDRTARSYPQSEAGFSDSSGTSIEGMDLENDDDYGGVDNVSAASDDSRDFEAEVEDALRQEEHRIDWDNSATYSYSSNWATGEYDLQHDLHIMEPMADFPLSYFGATDEGDVARPAPELSSREAVTAATGSYPFSWTDDNSSRSSSTTRDTPASSTAEDRRPSDATGPYNDAANGLHDEARDDGSDDTEDDEDDPRGTVSAPSTLLDHAARAPHPRRLSVVPPPPAFCPAESLPPLRRIRVNPKKTTAYTVHGPTGRRIRFIPPRTRPASKWIVISTPVKARAGSVDGHTDAGSASNSGPSSPTMINIDEAKVNGNTRTGAVITDHVYAAIFRSENCRPEVSPGPEPAPLSAFYRNLVGAAPMALDDPLLVDDEALFDNELIDFEQCDEPSTSATPATTPYSAVAETPVQDRAAAADGIFSDVAAPGTAVRDTRSMYASMPDIPSDPSLFPVTPFSNQLGGLGLGDSTSPRKRRMVDADDDATGDVGAIGGSSPSFKRSRLEGLVTPMPDITMM